MRYINDNNKKLDSLDEAILKTISENPSINVTDLWRTLRNKSYGLKRVTIYYRVNSLEKYKYIITKFERRHERRCYISEA